MCMKIVKKVILCFWMVIVLGIAGCSDMETLEDNDRSGITSEGSHSKEAVEFSDEYLVGFDFGGSSWGDFYDCLSVRVIICMNHDVMVFGKKMESVHQRDGELEQIAKLTLTEEQYSNIEKILDRQKLYKMKIKSNQDICDGSSYYLILYDKDENIAKACGAYEPTTKAFLKMYDGVRDNIPKDELREIRNEYVEAVRKFENPDPATEKNCYQAYCDYLSNVKEWDRFLLIDVDGDKTDELVATNYNPERDDEGMQRYVIADWQENKLVVTECDGQTSKMPLSETGYQGNDVMLIILRAEDEKYIEGVTQRERTLFYLASSFVWLEEKRTVESGEKVDAIEDYLIVSELGDTTDYFRINENGSLALFKFRMPESEVIRFYSEVMGKERTYETGSDSSAEVGVYCGEDGWLYGNDSSGLSYYTVVNDFERKENECIVHASIWNRGLNDRLADVTVTLTPGEGKYGYTLKDNALMSVSRTETGNTDIAGRENSSVPYDYDEAVAKLMKYCAGFPTSFGSNEECIFVNDVTGDGVEDLCTYVFFGSGMPRMDIVMFDVEKDKFYTLDGMNLRGAYGYDYRILSAEECGVIISERQFYPEEHAAKFGLLTFEEGRLGMEEFDKESSEYEHAKDIYEKLREGSMIKN